MPTAAQLRARWPEAFPSTWDPTDAVLDAAIAEASLFVINASNQWGAQRYEQALGYFAAHLAWQHRGISTAGTAGSSGTVAGPITSMSVDRVAVSFAAPLGGSGGGGSGADYDAWLASTPPGRLYLEMLMMTAGFRLPLLGLL